MPRRSRQTCLTRQSRRTSGASWRGAALHPETARDGPAGWPCGCHSASRCHALLPCLAACAQPSPAAPPASRRQTKLRVVLVGPPKPPSPVPEGVEEPASPATLGYRDTTSAATAGAALRDQLGAAQARRRTAPLGGRWRLGGGRAECMVALPKGAYGSACLDGPFRLLPGQAAIRKGQGLGLLRKRCVCSFAWLSTPGRREGLPGLAPCHSALSLHPACLVASPRPAGGQGGDPQAAGDAGGPVSSRRRRAQRRRAAAAGGRSWWRRPGSPAVLGKTARQRRLGAWP